MSRRRRIGRLGIVAGAFVTAATPVTVSMDRGVRAQTVECQSGTCCPEEKATCVIGNHQVGGYYQKASGSCIEQT